MWNATFEPGNLQNVRVVKNLGFVRGAGSCLAKSRDEMHRDVLNNEMLRSVCS